MAMDEKAAKRPILFSKDEFAIDSLLLQVAGCEQSTHKQASLAALGQVILNGTRRGASS